MPEEFRPFVNDYKINVFEIAHLPEEAVGYFHSDFKVVADYFVHKQTDPEYRPVDHVKFQHVDELLKMMAAITHDDRFLDVLYDEGGGKPEDMCEVLDRVEAKGEAKGVDKARLESIKNLMKNVGWTIQQTMDALGIPKAEQPKYAAKL